MTREEKKGKKGWKIVWKNRKIKIKIFGVFFSLQFSFK